MIFKNTKQNYNELKKRIDMNRLPKHIAIIMDGNGRWAQNKMLPRTSGHKEGVNRVKEIVEECGDLGVKHLTLYAFSTENWKRPKNEIEYLMNLLSKFIDKELETINSNNVKLNILGDLNDFNQKIINKIHNAIQLTKNNEQLVLNIALNYGGRNEITRAVKLIVNDIIKNELNLDDINEETFKNFLYTKNQPDPDLLIRTGGELRLSNFLIYQTAYTEFCFKDIQWPDFTKEYLYKSIIEYQNRNRRFGGI